MHSFIPKTQTEDNKIISKLKFKISAITHQQYCLALLQSPVTTVATRQSFLVVFDNFLTSFQQLSDGFSLYVANQNARIVKGGGRKPSESC